MAATVRMMCAACLRSVEWSRELSTRPMVCPHCGARLEADFVAAEDEDESDDRSLPDLTPEDLFDGQSFEATPVVPELVGRFQLREYLGGGGFGHVYRAYDPRLDRDVALKVLKEDQPSARKIERFFREARAAAQLDHPNIVSLHDAGREGSRCWIAYQFVTGQTLLERMGEARVDTIRAASWCRALADALDHAHRRGVFHRDLKPANVIIDALGEPRLTDFGLARRALVDPTLTHEGVVIGTPAYMSPEQAAGQGHAVDARSDLYSLGVILFELLCGQRPADLPSSVPAWRVQSGGVSVSPRRLVPSVPRALDRICRRALTTSPGDRYASARMMADDLEKWLESRRPRKTAWFPLIVLLALESFIWRMREPARPRVPPPSSHLSRNQTALESESEPRSAHANIHVKPSTKGEMHTTPPQALVVQKGGRVVHFAGCSLLSDVSPAVLQSLSEIESTERESLRACLFCRPDR